MKTDDFITQLSSELKPVKKLESLSRRILKWLFVAALCVVSALSFSSVREDWRNLFSYPLSLLQNILILLSIVASSTTALLLSTPGQERNKFLKVWVTLPLVLWVLVMMLGMLQTREFYPSPGLACSGDIFLLSLIPAAFLFFQVKQGATLMRGYSGFLVLLAAAGVGAWALQFSCHNNNPAHIFVWHFAPTILLGFIGVLIGQSLIKKL